MTESVLSAFADGRIRVAAATGLSVVLIIFVIRVNSCRFVIKHQNKNAQRFRCSDRPVGGEEPSRDGS